MNRAAKYCGFLKLVLLACALFAAAQVNSGRWPGMDKKNTAYDWLRPHVDVLRRTAQQKPEKEPHDYRRPGIVRFAAGRTVILMSISTPMQSAAAMGAARWNSFAEPDEESLRVIVRAVERSFTVGLATVTADSSDAPVVAVEWTQDGEKWLLPGKQDSISSKPRSADEGPGCRSIALFKFNTGADDRLTGVGYIIIRWGGEERRIPLDFDYLW